MKKTLRVYMAEDVDDDQVAGLRDEVKKALDDPNYSIITSFPFWS